MNKQQREGISKILAFSAFIMGIIIPVGLSYLYLSTTGNYSDSSSQKISQWTDAMTMAKNFYIIAICLSPLAFFYFYKKRKYNNTPEYVMWDGWECGDIEQIIGHMNWAHKDGVLMILNSTGLVFIPKDHIIEIDSSGNVIGKINPDLLDQSIINSANKLSKKENE